MKNFKDSLNGEKNVPLDEVKNQFLGKKWSEVYSKGLNLNPKEI